MVTKWRLSYVQSANARGLTEWHIDRDTLTNLKLQLSSLDFKSEMYIEKFSQHHLLFVNWYIVLLKVCVNVLLYRKLLFFRCRMNEITVIIKLLCSVCITLVPMALLFYRFKYTQLYERSLCSNFALLNKMQYANYTLRSFWYLAAYLFLIVFSAYLFMRMK